ncbi:hypothetical protein [Lentzea sp. NPDC055074]
MERFGGRESPESKPEFEPVPDADTTEHQTDRAKLIGHLALEHDLTPAPETRPAAAEHLGRTALNAGLQHDLTPAPLDYEALNRRPQFDLDPAHRLGDDGTSSGPPEPDDDAYHRLAEKIVNGADDPSIVAEREEAHARIAMVREIDDVEISGDPEAAVEAWLPQGRNDLGLRRTCAITAMSQIASNEGAETSESQLVHTAVREGLCDMTDDNPKKWGGATLDQQVKLIESTGLDCVQLHGQTVEQALDVVKNGHWAAIVVHRDEVQALTDPEKPNHFPQTPDLLGPGTHAVYLTNAVEVVQQPGSKYEVREYFGGIIQDPSGKPGVMLSTEMLHEVWEQKGGHLIYARPRDEGTA